MPILLDTPHRYDPGHGQPAIDYPMVIIQTMSMLAPQRMLVLRMQYGQVVDGVWDGSPEEPHGLRIRDEPAETSTQVDPDTGAPVDVEVKAANPAFSNLRSSFVIEAGDVGKSGYDVVGAFLYQYLITLGYYQGTVV